MFKVGDKIACVRPGWMFDLPCHFRRAPELVRNGEYTVARVIGGGAGVQLIEVWPEGDYYAFDARRFRKVERRNDSLSIEAFLTIKPGFEEPKRAPAKKRERV
jgi:hypothetical protein